ncbi:MAG: hypothetical protein HY519_03325 [Candidatus Aenigmarchaeota archaeon]|nr:hypothetical protein [Candidatus Aenigmarchaeota archaeon]
MDYCLLCKDKVEGQYPLEVKDVDSSTSVKGFVCRYCFHKFIESHENEGTFKLSRFIAWARERKDRMRAI